MPAAAKPTADKPNAKLAIQNKFDQMMLNCDGSMTGCVGHGMDVTEGRGAIMEVSGEMHERIAAYNSPISTARCFDAIRLDKIQVWYTMVQTREKEIALAYGSVVIRDDCNNGRHS
jgi:hypothetical protein